MSVLVLVDEANMLGAARAHGRAVDWEVLREVLADPDEGRRLIEMVLYMGLPPDIEEFREKRARKLKTVRWAENNGFLVVTKEGTPSTWDGRPSYRANVDVLMAIDAMDLALSVRPDLIVLVTGDSDFAHLARQLRRRGIRVEIASTPQAQSDMLRRAANSVLDLTQVIGSFRRLSGEAPSHTGVPDDLDEFGAE
jgi:uncharacterized LabA/DUF88 family protein